MVHVARQAILDARRHVVGYELLYAIASAETPGAPEPQLQQAYSGALIWAHELTAAGFSA